MLKMYYHYPYNLFQWLYIAGPGQLYHVFSFTMCIDAGMSYVCLSIFQYLSSTFFKIVIMRML